MNRLISLFREINAEANPGLEPRPPDEEDNPRYDQEPEYFRNLLDYLRDQRSADEQEPGQTRSAERQGDVT